MRRKREAPARVARTPDAHKAIDLVDVKSDSFISNSTHARRSRQGAVCHCCGGRAKRYGSHSALITPANGRAERRYLCADCVRNFQEGGENERA